MVFITAILAYFLALTLYLISIISFIPMAFIVIFILPLSTYTSSYSNVFFFKNFPAILIYIGDILLKQVLPISLFDIIISNKKKEIGESLEVMNEVQQD